MDKIPTAKEWLTPQVVHPSNVPVMKDIVLKFAKLHVQQFKEKINSDVKTHDGFALFVERLEELFNNYLENIK